VARSQPFTAVSLLEAMRSRRMYVRLSGQTIKLLGHGLTEWQAMGGQVGLPSTVPLRLEFAVASERDLDVELRNPEYDITRAIKKVLFSYQGGGDLFAGIGKPEPLKHILSGAWSRRIDDVNRLVYLVTDDHVIVLQARYHY